jgi:transposase
MTAEIDGLTRQITATVASHNPQLLQAFGVGPDSAAALLMTAGDNHGRLHSEASFAALCGTGPSKHHQVKPSATDSTAAATAKPTAPSTPSPSPACAGTSAPATT